jgi:phosphomannomutase
MLKIILSNDQENLEKLLGHRLAFGTAGLRGPMGAGYNCMNDLVVLQTVQGLVKYILKEFGETAKSMVGHFCTAMILFVIFKFRVS